MTTKAKTFARNVHLQIDTSLRGEESIVGLTGDRKLTLGERLELFNSEKQGGEAMACSGVSLEKL
jgi:hypothetical protein